MKQNFTLLDSAIHQTVLSFRDAKGQRGAAALAPLLNLRERTCQNKANPNQTAFYFRPEELLLLQKMTRNTSIMHTMAAELGFVCVPIESGPGGNDPLTALASWTARQADCMWAVAEYLQEKDPSRANVAELQATHFAAAGQGLAFLKAVEVRGHG